MVQIKKAWIIKTNSKCCEMEVGKKIENKQNVW